MSFANAGVSGDAREELAVAEPPSAHLALHDEPFTMRSGVVRNELSTGLVRLYRQVFGRGPVRTMTHAFEAGYVTFLHDILVPHERRLVESGRRDLVCEARMALREAQRERLIAEVEALTGQPVLHDSFQFQPERNLAIELFWVPTSSADGTGNSPKRTSTRHSELGRWRGA